MGRLLSSIALLALLVGLACSGDDDEVTPIASRPTSPAASTSTPEPGGTFVPYTPVPPTATPRPRPEANPLPEDLQEEALSLLMQIGEVRGTPARREIDMFLLTREQARAYYAGDTAETIPDEEPTDDVGDAEDGEQDQAPPSQPFSLREATYVLLGLIPPPQPPTPSSPGTGTLQEQEIDNLISQITGFYSNEFGALYLVENSGSCVQIESTIVHELTHALQYQYRDVDGLVRDRAGDWDGTRALLSVLEGDAVATEQLVLGFSTRSSCVREPFCFEIPPARSASPYVIERELDTWYEDGSCFIQAVRDKLTRGITGVFEDLPTTTEQILHPEKYLEGEPARPVFLISLADELGPGWEELGGADLGEFGLQNLLLLGLDDDRPRVQEAAAGWGGDSFSFYGNGDGGELLHLETRWDIGAEAREFYAALVASLVNRGADPPPEDGAASYRATIDGVTWSTTVASDRVTLLVSTDPDALEAAAAVVE
jgi:hypothetical protein